tara:strand:- start:995 stop:1234 length:240 start_codon:yes stop_codon:yes gene_type:complete
MFPFDYVDPFYFLMALCVGLLYTYVSSPPPRVVVKYPTPFNAGKITYVDDAGVCYRYKVKPTKCPSNPKKIKKMPLLQN